MTLDLAHFTTLQGAVRRAAKEAATTMVMVARGEALCIVSPGEVDYRDRVVLWAEPECHLELGFPLRTIDDVKRANKVAGLHFFDGVMTRAFRSKLCPKSAMSVQREGATYFITSEKESHCPEEQGLRRYTVRRANWATGRVATAGGSTGLMRYSTRKGAIEALHEFVAGTHVLQMRA